MGQLLLQQAQCNQGLEASLMRDGTASTGVAVQIATTTDGMKATVTCPGANSTISARDVKRGLPRSYGAPTWTEPLGGTPLCCSRLRAPRIFLQTAIAKLPPMPVGRKPEVSLAAIATATGALSTSPNSQHLPGVARVLQQAATDKHSGEGVAVSGETEGEDGGEAAAAALVALWPVGVQRSRGAAAQRQGAARRLSLRQARVEVVLMQLELPLLPMQELARTARDRGCLVAVKPSPLPPHFVSKAEGLLHGLADICFLNEHEAPTLLGWGEEDNPLVTLEQAERAAAAVLARFASLRLVLITTQCLNVLRIRDTGGGAARSPGGAPPRSGPPPRLVVSIPPRDEEHDDDDDEEEGGGLGVGARETLLVLPRSRMPVIDVIGAADAFVGGFLAARCRRLSMCQALLWAYAAGTLSTLQRGAQESMPDVADLRSFLQAQMSEAADVTAAALTSPHRDEPPRLPTTAASAADDEAAAAEAAVPMAPRALRKGSFLEQSPLHLAAMRLDFSGTAAG